MSTTKKSPKSKSASAFDFSGKTLEQWANIPVSEVVYLLEDKKDPTKKEKKLTGYIIFTSWVTPFIKSVKGSGQSRAKMNADVWKAVKEHRSVNESYQSFYNEMVKFMVDYNAEYKYNHPTQIKEKKPSWTTLTNGYRIFTNETRLLVAEELEQILGKGAVKQPDIMREIGARWRETSEHVKKSYKEKAAIENEKRERLRDQNGYVSPKAKAKGMPHVWTPFEFFVKFTVSRSHKDVTGYELYNAAAILFRNLSNKEIDSLTEKAAERTRKEAERKALKSAENSPRSTIVTRNSPRKNETTPRNTTSSTRNSPKNEYVSPVKIVKEPPAPARRIRRPIGDNK